MLGADDPVSRPLRIAVARGGVLRVVPVVRGLLIRSSLGLGLVTWARSATLVLVFGVVKQCLLLCIVSDAFAVVSLSARWAVSYSHVCVAIPVTLRSPSAAPLGVASLRTTGTWRQTQWT